MLLIRSFNGNQMESAVWGLIGTIVGALASIVTTWISSRNDFILQKQASSLERMEKQRAFQRDTLLELQDALHDIARMSARLYFEDLASFKVSNDWGKSYLSNEVNEGLVLANRRMSILIARVADNQLRSELKEIMKIITQASFAKSHAEAESANHLIITAFDNVMERLGNVLRSLYYSENAVQ
jgi:hypothetical protein